MLAFYLFALILGGGLLLLSVLGGDGGEGDLDLDVDVDSIDGGDASASKIFSIRSAIYTLFGFGATGSLLTWLEVGGTMTAVSAVATGLASGALITAVFSWLEKTDSGSHPGNRSLIGAMGRVTLPPTSTVPGTVVVARGTRELSLRALPHSSADGDPADWQRIVVVEIDGSGVARIAPLAEGELTAG